MPPSWDQLEPERRSLRSKKPDDWRLRRSPCFSFATTRRFAIIFPKVTSCRMFGIRTFMALPERSRVPQGTLAEAVDALLEHLADDAPLPYDHLVLDEAQDFDRDWLEFLQARFRDRAFYAFYDPHQNIQGEPDTAWLDQIPCRLNLSRNCRNTLEVARSAYRAAGARNSSQISVPPVPSPLFIASTLRPGCGQAGEQACRQCSHRP